MTVWLYPWEQRCEKVLLTHCHVVCTGVQWSWHPEALKAHPLFFYLCGGNHQATELKKKAGISGSSTEIRKEWWFVTVGISCLLTGAVKRPSQPSAGVGGAAGCTGPSVELPVWWSPSVDSSQSVSSIINKMAQTLIGVWPVCTFSCSLSK